MRVPGHPRSGRRNAAHGASAPRHPAGHATLRVAALLLAMASPVGAAAAGPVAADPALEQRVQALSNQLRCLVCQNQTIADSHAELAVDLKNQVREQLQAGRSEAQVLDYMTERYGDFVLYRPPWKASTLLLWTSPLIALAVGGLLLIRSIRRGAQRAPLPDLDGDAGLAELQGAAPASSPPAHPMA